MEHMPTSSSCCKAFLIIASAVIYAVAITLTAYLDGPADSFFNTTHINLSHKYPTPITPLAAVFSIWGVIYLWEIISGVYCMTLLCRKCNGTPLYISPGVVPATFFVFFIMNAIIANPLWSVVSLEEELVLACCLSVIGFVCLVICLVSSCKELDKSGSTLEQNGHSADIWCTRIIVQNGIALYLPWAGLATGLNIIVSLHYVFEVSMTICCFGVLIALNILIVGWFILEFVYDRQLRYVFVHYGTLVISFYGIYKQNYDPEISYQVYAMLIMIQAILLTVVKLIVMIVRSVKDPIHYPKNNKMMKFEPLVEDVIVVKY